MRKYLDTRGSAGPLVTLLIIIVVFYAGFKFAMPYYNLNSFKIDAASIINLDISQEDMKTRIYKSALDYNIPINIDNLNVTKDPETTRVTASAKWTESIDLFGHTVKKLNLGIDITK